MLEQQVKQGVHTRNAQQELYLMSRQIPYQPMHERKIVSHERMNEILAKNAHKPGPETQSPQEKSGPSVWPKASQETAPPKAPPRQVSPLQWQKPERGSMGVRTVDEWYSCCKIGQPDGSFKYEVWTREPLTGGMKQLAVGLSSFEEAKAIAQADADKAGQ